MVDLQWLVTPAVGFLAVIVAIYFGNRNLRNVITQRELESAYANGRVDARLENLEQLVPKVENLEQLLPKVENLEQLLPKVENLEQLVPKVENLEQLVRTVNENLRVMNEKLDAHDVLLRQVRREAKKQSRRLRKLRKRVEVLESNGTVPPTDPASSEARMASQPVRSPRLAHVSREGPAVGRSGRTT